jgi:DNA-binding winged helix-turn-helix (wHTH) protein
MVHQVTLVYQTTLIQQATYITSDFYYCEVETLKQTQDPINKKLSITEKALKILKPLATKIIYY